MSIEKLSIVVPCYNEEGNIVELINRLKSVLEQYTFNYEVILVDDGSQDTTFNIIEAQSRLDDKIKGYSLSRNFGHQIALFAGLEMAEGNVVITMDGDLQHPVRVIPDLIAKYEEGYEIVNTIRAYDKSETVFKKLTSRWFYAFINRISDTPIEPQSSDFRLMGKEAVDAFLTLKEHNRFTRGLVQWIGFKQTAVQYQADKRFSGSTGYSLKKMISLAVDGVTSMSSKPLRLSLYLGFILCFAGVIYAIFVLINYIRGINVEGWTSILISILVIGGIQLLILSIMGEYVSKIFNEAKDRPLYIVKAKTPETD